MFPCKPTIFCLPSVLLTGMLQNRCFLSLVCLASSLNCSCPRPMPGPLQTWHFAHTLNGQKILTKILPPNVAWIRFFFVQKISYRRNKQIVFFKFFCHTHNNTYVSKKNRLLDQQTGQKNAEHYNKLHMLELKFTPEGKVLHGQCPCVLDKFCVCGLSYLTFATLK